MRWVPIVLAAAFAAGLGVVLGSGGTDSPLGSTAASTITFHDVVARGAVAEEAVAMAAGPVALDGAAGDAARVDGAATLLPDDAAIERELALRPELWVTPGHATIEGVLARVPIGGDGAAAARKRIELFLERGTRRPGDGLEVVGPIAFETGGPEPELEAAVFASGAEGRWTQPVRTAVGWVVVKAREVVAPRARTLAEASEEVRRWFSAGAALRQRKLEALRNRARIGQRESW